VTNRIDRKFTELKEAGRCGIIPFITAGDPSLDATVPVMHQLVRAGADLLELGVPFSDPMADGPVIQASSERALERGVGIRQVLSMVETFRQEDDSTPVILMGYMNPIERLGHEAMAAAAAAAGVDGLLLVDCPPEEADSLHSALREQDIHSIYLIAPTTTQARIETICQAASGFLYYVSLKGVTGASQSGAGDLESQLSRIRAASQLPVAVGFGIKNAASAAAVARVTDAVVIGSALVDTIKSAASVAEAVALAGEFIQPVSAALLEYNEPVALTRD